VTARFETRRLTVADVEAWREIRLAGLRDAPEAFSSTHRVEAARPLRDFAERLETSLVLAAGREGRIVGVVGLARRPGREEARRAFLWGLYVRPEVRRLGAGRLLLSAVFAAASDRFEQVTLDVAADNFAAIALYEKSGFVQYGGAPRALKTASGYRDEISLVKFLDAGQT
jgi:ribosomal protein S18 acetylase RimI-like enzyme